MRTAIAILALCFLLTGCQTITDAQAQSIHDNAQASANAAASLPPSKQTARIIDSQKAIAAAVGQPFNSTTVVTP